MNEPGQEKTVDIFMKEFQDEYKELSDDWRAIDQKADSTLRFSATLLAATAAVVFRSNWHEQHLLANLLLIPGIALCLFSAFSGLSAARVRSPLQPPRGTDSFAAVDALLSAPPACSEPLMAFHRQQLHRWDTTNRDIRSQANNKAAYLEYAHFAVAWGVTLIVLAVAAHVYLPLKKDLQQPTATAINDAASRQ